MARPAGARILPDICLQEPDDPDSRLHTSCRTLVYVECAKYVYAYKIFMNLSCYRYLKIPICCDFLMPAAQDKVEMKTIKGILNGRKYNIGYFQREYKWKKRQIEQLIHDLELKFSTQYSENHEVKDIVKYEKYHMGTIITSSTNQGHSIIDGQQRLTSLTLLLIYLNNLQKSNIAYNKKLISIDTMIFSDKYDKRTYNLDIEDRSECMNSLCDDIKFTHNTESEENIIRAYQDIKEIFSYDANDEKLKYFIWWLIENVVFVEISMASDDKAYSIFETMNDRGLSLTSTEMLKGYILFRVGDISEESVLDHKWKNEMEKIKKIGKDEDAEFFKAWLKGKYAEIVRSKSTEKEDFEKIGIQFHNWLKENESRMNLSDEQSFKKLLDKELPFYVDLYLKINTATKKFDKNLEYVYYIGKLGVANTFYYPMLMSPITMHDDTEVKNKKMNMCARFLEIFYMFKKINHRTTEYSSIKHTIFNIIKEIRNKSVDELAEILKEKTKSIDENLKNMKEYGIQGNTKKYVKYTLIRITSHIEEKSGKNNTFKEYISRDVKDKITIEHLLSRDIDYSKNEFENEQEFEKYRNMIGALILLPESFNKSYGSLPYDKKLEHYYGHNLLAQTLAPKCYELNSEFKKYYAESRIPFKPHPEFKKQDVIDRQALYQKICEEIWSVDGFEDC